MATMGLSNFDTLCVRPATLEGTGPPLLVQSTTFSVAVHHWPVSGLQFIANMVGSVENRVTIQAFLSMMQISLVTAFQQRSVLWHYP